MEWAVRLVGVFYLTAGAVALWQAWAAWRMERALAGVMPLSDRERKADAMVLLSAVFLLASGVALMTLHLWTVVIFVSSWCMQAFYMLWSQHCLPVSDPLRSSARRAGLHAFAVYSAVTLLVIVMGGNGVLGAGVLEAAGRRLSEEPVVVRAEALDDDVYGLEPATQSLVMDRGR